MGRTLSVDAAMDVEPNIPEIQATVDAATGALGRGALALGRRSCGRTCCSIDPDAAAAVPPLAPAIDTGP